MRTHRPGRDHYVLTQLHIVGLGRPGTQVYTDREHYKKKLTHTHTHTHTHTRELGQVTLLGPMTP